MGAAFRLLTQVARFAPLYDVPIDDATADVRPTFLNTEKYDVDDAPRYFEEVTIRLDIVSPASAEQVQLRRPIPVKLETTLNGLRLDS